jgi:hypothetical protein
MRLRPGEFVRPFVSRSVHVNTMRLSRKDGRNGLGPCNPDGTRLVNTLMTSLAKAPRLRGLLDTWRRLRTYLIVRPVRAQDITHRPVGRIVSSGLNPKRQSDGQIAAISASLRQYAFNAPPLADNHQRRARSGRKRD